KAANSGFKREAWIAALLKLNSTHNIKYNVQKFKARHAELKKQYSTVSQMVKTSGIGFESSTCRFVCTEGSWSHFLRDKPKKWSLWETKRFPQYPLCQALYDGTLATGEFVCASTENGLGNDNETDEMQEDSSQRSNCIALIVPPSEDDGEHEYDDAASESSDFPQGRRSATPYSRKPSKRARHSLAAAMIKEMKSMRESGRQEVDLMRQSLTSIDERSTASSPVEIAMDTLHEDF
ncbi:hypothetical protein AeNC1_017945, partial [Aphanomyces euteiches]